MKKNHQLSVNSGWQVDLSTRLPVSPSACLPIYLFTRQPIQLSTYQPVDLLNIDRLVNLSSGQPVNLPTHQPVKSSVIPSTCQPFDLSSCRWIFDLFIFHPFFSKYKNTFRSFYNLKKPQLKQKLILIC